MTVETPRGVVAGTTARTPHGDVEAFLGIPFASAPRFHAPRPVPRWEGVREAMRPGPGAPQNPDPVMVAAGIPMPPTDEAACLNLSVWTPASDGRRRPVMVWTHGGAYVSGSNASGITDGAALAAALDVVVVAANYRLGALGFLAVDHLLGDGFADSGALAVLDQIAALEWVRDTIDRFGGDPDDVTIFGESAGGAMVCTLLGSPAASGLFRHAIVQSGTAERVRTAEDARGITAEILAALGLTEADAERLLDLDIDELLAAQARVVDDHARRTIGLPLPFQPMLGTRALPERPLDAIRAGVNADVDLLAGTNLNEASFFTALRPLGEGESALDLARSVVETDAGPDAFAPYRAALGSVLGREPAPAEIFESALTDRMYRQPTNRLLDARLAAATGRTFSYLFTWPSPMMGGRLGACHALDVPFVFRALRHPEATPLVGGDAPLELSERMSEAWGSFARNGAPSAATLPIWPDYTAERRAVMIFDTDARVEDDPRGSLRTLWNRAGRR